MNTLSDVIKIEEKKTTSSKNPAFYQKELRTLIKDLSCDENAMIRMKIASHPKTPAKTVLAVMLRAEADKDVVRAILMNPNLPKKSIIEFCATERSAIFKTDKEVVEYLQKRLGD